MPDSIVDELSYACEDQYEALRAYFVEQRPSHEVARAFGYTAGSFRVLCHQFRREQAPAFFVSIKHGPRSQPKKSTAVERIVALRKRNYSIYEISETLRESKLSLSPTAVREVLKQEGFAPLPRRLDEERPERPHPTIEPVADARAFSLTPRTSTTRCGGLFLFASSAESVGGFLRERRGAAWFPRVLRPREAARFGDRKFVAVVRLWTLWSHAGTPARCWPISRRSEAWLHKSTALWVPSGLPLWFSLAHRFVGGASFSYLTWLGYTSIPSPCKPACLVRR